MANQQPAPMLAAVEQQRADGLAATIADIQDHPGSARNNSLPLYQMAYRDASAAAARYSEQPTGWNQ